MTQKSTCYFIHKERRESVKKVMEVRRFYDGDEVKMTSHYEREKRQERKYKLEFIDSIIRFLINKNYNLENLLQCHVSA